MSAPTPSLGPNNILDSTSREVDKVSSPSVLIDVSKPVSRVSVLQENCSTPNHGSTSRTLYITLETPPRSPSPEIDREDPPDNDHHIHRFRCRLLSLLRHTVTTQKPAAIVFGPSVKVYV